MKTRDGALGEAPAKVAGQIGDIDKPSAVPIDRALLPEPVRRPGKCLIGLPHGIGASAQPARVEIRIVLKELADCRPIEAHVPVGRIVDGAEAGSRNDGEEVPFPPPQERADDAEFFSFKPNRANAGEAGNARPPPQPHQEGFGLIVGMVGGCERRDAAIPRPSGKRRIARAARVTLNAASAILDINGETVVRATEIGADARHVPRLIRCFGAEAVIDRCGGNAARESRPSQKQQGQTVRPARYRKPQQPFFLLQAKGVGAKPGDLVGSRVAIKGRGCGHSLS